MPGLSMSTPAALEPLWVDEQKVLLGHCHHPDWAGFYIDKLQPLIVRMIQKCGGVLTLNLWLDFAGMAPEKEAGNLIALKLRERHGAHVQFMIYMACDVDPSSRTFIDQNFHPKHMSDDATQRDWDTGTLTTTLGELLHIPREGIDIYVACYPCGPWSKRGRRLGLHDADGRLYEVAIKTVQILNCYAYLMENVCEIELDLEIINKYAQDKLPNYTTLTLKGIDPLQFDYPVRKNRLLQLGTNNGGCHPSGLHTSVALIVQNPMPLTKTYRQFLGLGNVPHGIQWSRFNALPTLDEMQVLASSEANPCSCSTDATVLCARHPCQCKTCKKHGTHLLQCVWRQKALEFIHIHFGQNGLTDDTKGKLTYCNVVDIYKGLDVQSPRVRNLLNIVAHLPRCHPLAETIAVLDVSQSIDRINLTIDGTTPTAATNSQLLCLCDAEVLTEFQMGELMGHNMRALQFKGMSAHQARRLLGMSVHVSVMGVGLLALIGAMGHDVIYHDAHAQ